MDSHIHLTVSSLMLEHALDAALIIDGGAQIKFYNQAFEKLSGYGASDLLGHSLNRLLPDSVAGRHDSLLAQYLLAPGDSTVLGRPREMTLQDSGGREIPVELKAVDLGMTEGTHFFGAFLADLRPRKALEAQNQALLARLEQEALTDPLTSLPNRRAFDAEGWRAMARARRRGTATALAVFDIDHFKHINDRFGHAAGDAVLKRLARSVEGAMRAGYFFARIGGEEFGLILPQTKLEQAIPAVERIREAVAMADTDHDGHPKLTVTVSAGLAVIDPTTPLHRAFARADAALYAAKAEGRDRLRIG